MPQDIPIVADPTDRDALLRAFAATYEADHDPWTILETHNRVQRFLGKHPNAGSSKVASALDVPRSMIRRWVDDGAVPYVVQGVQTVEVSRWDDIEWGEPPFSGLNRLVAWIFSSGHLHGGKWTPHFICDDDSDEQRLQTAAETAGVNLVESERDADRDRDIDGTELWPAENRAELGRLLAVLGAPVGRKLDGEIALPPYLQRAPDETRAAFARTYIRNRRKKRPDENGIYIGEKRPDAYLDELQALLADVTGEYVSRHGNRDIYLSPDAGSALGV